MPGLGLRPEALTQKDPRNANFLMADITEADEANLPNYAHWLTQRKPLDQGSTGTCVGHAGRHFLDHPPVVQVKVGKPPTAWDLYRGCVSRDQWSGNDHEASLPDGDHRLEFGTSTLALMKTLKDLKLIGDYRWAWDVDTVSRFMRMQGKNFKGRLGGPVIVGTWWYDSMFQPDAEGFLRIVPTARAVGGHEWMIKAVDARRGIFRMRNSWGTNWGIRGEAFLSFDTMARLFSEDGDAVTTNELKLAA